MMFEIRFSMLRRVVGEDTNHGADIVANPNRATVASNIE